MPEVIDYDSHKIQVMIDELEKHGFRVVPPESDDVKKPPKIPTGVVIYKKRLGKKLPLRLFLNYNPHANLWQRTLSSFSNTSGLFEFLFHLNSQLIIKL